MVSMVKKVGVLASTSLALAAGGLTVASPAQAAGIVYADCTVSIGGKNHDMVYISCADVVGGQARGRADCSFAPDVYTKWITSWDSSEGGPCLFKAAGAVLETRAV
jgi:hypothetical protein